MSRRLLYKLADELRLNTNTCGRGLKLHNAFWWRNHCACVLSDKAMRDFAAKDLNLIRHHSSSSFIALTKKSTLWMKQSRVVNTAGYAWFTSCLCELPYGRRIYKSIVLNLLHTSRKVGFKIKAFPGLIAWRGIRRRLLYLEHCFSTTPCCYKQNTEDYHVHQNAS